MGGHRYVLLRPILCDAWCIRFIYSRMPSDAFRSLPMPCGTPDSDGFRESLGTEVYECNAV